MVLNSSENMKSLKKNQRNCLFIHQKYGYPPRKSAIIVGVVYDISIILVPILGMVIDRIGKRGTLMLICSLMMTPVYIILAFTDIQPLVATVWLGITYSIASAVIWPAVPLVVKQSLLGTAMGVNNSIQMLGVGLANLGVGEILGKNNSLSSEERLQRWKYMMIFLLCASVACFTGAIFVNISDSKQGGILNQNRLHQNTDKLITKEVNVEQPDRSKENTDEKEPLLRSQKTIN